MLKLTYIYIYIYIILCCYEPLDFVMFEDGLGHSSVQSYGRHGRCSKF